MMGCRRVESLGFAGLLPEGCGFGRVEEKHSAFLCWPAGGHVVACGSGGFPHGFSRPPKTVASPGLKSEALDSLASPVARSNTRSKVHGREERRFANTAGNQR